MERQSYTHRRKNVLRFNRAGEMVYQLRVSCKVPKFGSQLRTACIPRPSIPKTLGLRGHPRLCLHEHIQIIKNKRMNLQDLAVEYTSSVSLLKQLSKACIFILMASFKCWCEILRISAFVLFFVYSPDCPQTH